jgi:hypothetical protein
LIGGQSDLERNLRSQIKDIADLEKGLESQIKDLASLTKDRLVSLEKNFQDKPVDNSK